MKNTLAALLILVLSNFSPSAAEIGPVEPPRVPVALGELSYHHDLLHEIEARPAVPPERPRSRGIDNALSYRLRRFALTQIDRLWGLRHSYPQAGPALSEELIEEAGGKDHVFSDYDDTLGRYATPLAPETAEAIGDLLAAGKTFAVVTDRPSLRPLGGSVSVLDSIAPIPVARREGLYIASKNDGYILRIEKGVPKVLHEEAPFPEPERTAIRQAVDAVEPKLASWGTAKVKDELSAFAYALLVTVGTPEATVVEIARSLRAELKTRGLDYRVDARLAKDPAKPPYVTFTRIDKSWAIRKLSELTGARPGNTVILGDSMFAPQRPTGGGKIVAYVQRAAERLSGRPMPLTGNAVDRDMERALPGALTLSVGETMDPTVRNGHALAGKGPGATLRVLRAAAAKRPSPGKGSNFGFMGAAALFFSALAICGMVVFAVYALISATLAAAQPWLARPPAPW